MNQHEPELNETDSVENVESGFRKWLGDEISRFFMWGQVPVEEIIYGLEDELESLYKLQAELEEQEVACCRCSAYHGKLHERGCSEEICPYCSKLLKTCGCTGPDGGEVPDSVRIPHHARCPDCDAEDGKLHDRGCCMEICPYCKKSHCGCTGPDGGEIPDDVRIPWTWDDSADELEDENDTAE